MKLYRIKKSDIDKKGRGLYATKDIKEGTKIIDYIGKLITKKQTMRFFIKIHFSRLITTFFAQIEIEFVSFSLELGLIMSCA